MSVPTNKFNFDQFPDNATTSNDRGFILKTSVDDLGASSGNAAFQGVSFHVCIFIPRFAGVCYRPAIWMLRLKISNQMNWVPGANLEWAQNFDESAAEAEFKLPFFDNTKVRNFLFPPQVFINQTGGLGVFAADCGLTWDIRSGSKKIGFVVGRPPVNQLYPCVSYRCICQQDSQMYTFGLPGTSTADILGSGSPRQTQFANYQACVAQPADLPTRMKQLFPDSWLV